MTSSRVYLIIAALLTVLDGIVVGSGLRVLSKSQNARPTRNAMPICG